MKFEKVKLNDICNLITCGVAKRPNYVETGVPFLSARNVKKQKIIWNNFRFITQKSHEELTKHNKPLKGDILYTRVGSYGEAAIIDEDREFSLFVSLTLIKPKHDIVNNKFLVYFLNSPMGKLLAKNNVNSSGVGNLNVGKVRNFEILLPPLQEQQRIVAKLDTTFAEIYKAIANDEKTLANIKNLNNKIFDKLLNNSKCKNVFLNDICNVERGSSPRPIKSFLTEEKDGVNWIKIGDTKQDEKYISSTKQKITKDGAKQSRIVKKGDFVLTNSMSYGRPYIMSINGCVHDGWFVLRLKDDIDSDFFYYLLSSESVQNQFKSLAAGSVVKNISGDLVKKTMLLLPSKKMQIEIREKLSIIGEHIKKINKLTLVKIENYQKLRLSIFKNLIGLNTKKT